MSRFFLRAYLDDAAEVSSHKYGIVLAQPWAITGFGLFFFWKKNDLVCPSPQTEVRRVRYSPHLIGHYA